MSKDFKEISRTRAWPEGTRKCKSCELILPLDAFGVCKSGARGRYPHCNECRKPIAKKLYGQTSTEYRMWFRCKGRAKRKGVPFTLKRSDVVIPEYCPVLGVKLVAG